MWHVRNSTKLRRFALRLGLSQSGQWTKQPAFLRVVYPTVLVVLDNGLCNWIFISSPLSMQFIVKGVCRFFTRIKALHTLQISKDSLHAIV